MKQNSLELWGGLECSHTRLGDSYVDQLARTGHDARPADLDQFAGLGLRTLRYPVLWEHVSPQHPEQQDWRAADERLARLRQLGINPIVGLVHHGSGPRYTDLTQRNFAPGLAAHAGAVARRFPWLTDYTPVNEPLTTARFSGLYGVWYPHGRDDRTFVRILLNELEATRLSMRAIRAVNPAARLIQTEDLGQTHGPDSLSDLIGFENERRWLSFDILCGRVSSEHPLWAYLRQHGASQAELRSWLDDPCPPDMLGLNYYLTSERHLDDATHAYPPHMVGGGRAYADVEAVRIGGSVELVGIRDLLGQAGRRYGRPLAITEAHLGCTRDEQVRWLAHVWQQAQQARRLDGIDVRAVTVWALLGLYDWDSLLTRADGHYEAGAFDVRSGRPRPTLLAGLVRALATGRPFRHPVLAGPGWWQRPERVHFEPGILEEVF